MRAHLRPGVAPASTAAVSVDQRCSQASRGWLARHAMAPAGGTREATRGVHSLAGLYSSQHAPASPPTGADCSLLPCWHHSVHALPITSCVYVQCVSACRTTCTQQHPRRATDDGVRQHHERCILPRLLSDNQALRALLVLSAASCSETPLERPAARYLSRRRTTTSTTITGRRVTDFTAAGRSSDDPPT